MKKESKNKKGWVARRYGSRRGIIETYRHNLLFHLGAYRRYRAVDWASVERLVFICKGNICRSAFAEAVARPLGMPYDIKEISCGLDTVEGAPANEIAILTAKKFSVDLSDHKTTPITKLKLNAKTDLLIAMEPGQLEKLQLLFDDKYQYTLLGLWLKPALPYLHDPYGSSPAYFQKCFVSIESAVQAIIRKCVK